MDRETESITTKIFFFGLLEGHGICLYIGLPCRNVSDPTKRKASLRKFPVSRYMRNENILLRKFPVSRYMRNDDILFCDLILFPDS